MTAAATCDESAPQPLGARSYAVGRGVHYWGSIAPDPASQETYVDPIDLGNQVFHPCTFPPGLWQVTTTAVEYRRLIDEGTALPLDEPAYSQTPPGVEPATRRTVFQLQVTADDGVDKRVFECDANQSFTIVAQSVCMGWMGPTGAINVQYLNATQRALFPRSGMVIDAFLGASLSRIEASPGSNSEIILTKHLWVPAATRASIAIPAYARGVTIYQEPTLGSASVMWTQTLGDPNGVSGSMTIASLPFIAGARRTQQESVLPNTTHLWTDITPEIDGNRFFTLRFVIRP